MNQRLETYLSRREIRKLKNGIQLELKAAINSLDSYIAETAKKQ